MAISYFGNNDLEKLILLIKNELDKYVKAVEGKGLSTEDFTTAYKTALDGLATTYAPLASPALTGTPTAPTATKGTNTTQVATTAFVIAQLADITGIKFDGTYNSYDDLVARVTNPQVGTIYLVKNSGTAPNCCDEYFWNASTSKFELFGTTAVDLTGYLKEADVTEIPTTDVETKWNQIFA